jgi:hypothetical protein
VSISFLGVRSICQSLLYEGNVTNIEKSFHSQRMVLVLMDLTGRVRAQSAEWWKNRFSPG